MSLSFFASPGKVFLEDGPWSARLTEEQTDQLLTIFEEANAVTSFNSLYQACQSAGFPEYVVSTPALRVVGGRS